MEFSWRKKLNYTFVIRKKDLKYELSTLKIGLVHQDRMDQNIHFNVKLNLVYY